MIRKKKLIGFCTQLVHDYRVTRLHAFFYKQGHEQTGSIISAALDSQYCDQSHFIRDFKAFTGKTPKAFLNSPPEIYESLLESLMDRYIQSLLYWGRK
ncbi:helix-turn-helix domain-containing protein [Alteromonas sp. ASW11-36]|uniref:Helix-turn-helix domain-containing protein n=1 Tax=Alteromonas arenosi TaxID=3055817 RepID=A0ABT7STT6_9ALTE|nr:AraC family transcriptional regulator [Alteromonas sp. ASW11-36]MDM7859414.1 helix-turn-helix domain-containing protein [Alteromonas sp. ASW11-36]